MRLTPRQSVPRIASRPVLTSNPALVPEGLQSRHNIGVMNLAGVWFLTIGYSGDLHMTNEVELSLQVTNKITLHNLTVIDVELQSQVICADGLDDRHGLVLARQKVARHISMVNRLD